MRLRYFCLPLCIVAALAFQGCTSSSSGMNPADTAAQPRNVILLIGDGMGLEEVKAAGMFAYGESGSLVFESWPHFAEAITDSATESGPTDSAAAATALATGHKVTNGVLGLQLPGDGHELPTVLEAFRDQGRSTGLITTVTIHHATPAGFAAHERSRNNSIEICQDMLERAKPTLLMGGGGAMTPEAATSAGYTVVQDRQQLNQAVKNRVERLCGLFSEGYMPMEYNDAHAETQQYKTIPHLSEMTAAALDILDRNPRGFFLMVEGGQIDSAGHSNQLEQNIGETVEFNRAVKVVADWVRKHPDTLVLVTADHETGGLKVLQNNGKGKYPTVSWSTKNHTRDNVGVWAIGPGSEMVQGVIDNTDIYRIMMGQSPLPPSQRPKAGSGESENEQPADQPAMMGS